MESALEKVVPNEFICMYERRGRNAVMNKKEIVEGKCNRSYRMYKWQQGIGEANYSMMGKSEKNVNKDGGKEWRG